MTIFELVRTTHPQLELVDLPRLSATAERYEVETTNGFCFNDGTHSRVCSDAKDVRYVVQLLHSGQISVVECSDTYCDVCDNS